MNNKIDRHELYQKSVQDPETEINLMVEKYQEIRGRVPVSFREDFCGTAFLSVEWCKRNPENTAIGVD
ncbi:MAG: class I SAM-dependent methyltransferase, partial [Gammaproteobacteria bacterium]|nr:class I SAM-dependent methyltransferase [Gammaproteobacteria bacterium]